VVRVGIIGLGFMGRMHLENYQKHPEVKVVAVADTVSEKLKGDLSGGGNIPTEKDIFDFRGIRPYEKANELIADKDVDLVVICLPTYLHARFTTKALEEGKHVLCEKPMAGSLEECDSMIEAAERTGRKLMIGQCLRFWPEYEVLKDYVENGKIGRLISLFCFRGGETPTWSADNWLLQKDKGGGALLDQHIHDVDTINFLLGIPESVSSRGRNVIKGSGIDIISTNYYYPEGPVVNALDNWTLNGGFGFNMTYLAGFEKGNIVFDARQHPTIKVNLDEGKSFTPELPSGDGYSREIDYLIKGIIEDKSMERISPRSARDSVRITLAEMKSVEENRPVRLSEI